VTVQLTTADLQHVAGAAEALLRPLGDGGVAAWWRDVEPRVRALFAGSSVMLSLPAGTRVRHEMESVDPTCIRRIAELAEVERETGRIVMFDPVLAAWERYRRSHAIGGFAERMAKPLIRGLGLDFTRSTWYNEALAPRRMLEAMGLASAELASAMGISVHTVRRHTESVMRKLGVHSRKELAAVLLRA
jgi:hypothetical protein